jgi:predicted PurR-regulated permease PerM
MTPWSNLTRTIVITVGLVLIGWLLYAFRPLVGPLIIAALLAYTLNPLVNVVQRRSRLNRKWAVPLVYLVGLTVVMTIISLLTPVVVGRLSDFLTGLVNVETQLETLLDKPIVFAGQQLHLGSIVADLLNVTGESLTSVAEGTRTVLEVTSISLLWLLLVLVSAYYFLLDGEKLRGWLVRLAPDSVQADIHRLVDEINVIWLAWPLL